MRVSSVRNEGVCRTSRTTTQIISPMRNTHCVLHAHCDPYYHEFLPKFHEIFCTMDPSTHFIGSNFSVKGNVLEYPVCSEWRKDPEDSIFYLANILLVLGFMGGSGFYGLLYMFCFLSLGFLCYSVWSWADLCTTDSFSWTFALFVLCVAQVIHVSYRLRSVTFGQELQDLYDCMFKRIGVSLTQFGRIVDCCDGDVHTIEKDLCFAVEGKTPIDKLSVLLSGRIRVTVNGEFLHYIYPFQFLDSPEWDSLRPSEEGFFQVTLRADNRCRYVAWRRKKLYLLFAQHRYIAKIFALLVRSDIAEKLFSLNDKAFDSRGFRYDLRLPSFCHRPEPEIENTRESRPVSGHNEPKPATTDS